MNRIRLTVFVAMILALLAPISRAVDMFDPFGPADLSTYGGPQPQRNGYFFSVETLYWNLPAPDKSQIGQPSTVIIPNVFDGVAFRDEFSTHDTGMLNQEFNWGSRIEMGRVQDQFGIQLSMFKIGERTQKYAANNVDVVLTDVIVPGIFPSVGLLSGFIDAVPFDGFDDDLNNNGLFGRFFDGNGDGVIDPNDPADQLPKGFINVDYGDTRRLPGVFEELLVVNKRQIWGVELMPYFRAQPTHRNGHFDFLGGVRYMKYFEVFNVLGTGGALDESNWNTRTHNDMIGPQIGLRWSKQKGRLTLSTEGRYFAGFNFQTIRQFGNIATEIQPASPVGTQRRPDNVPAILSPTSFNNSLHENEYSNVIELRLQAHAVITRSISATAGWTGIWMDGIARPSNMVDYSLPTFGILADQNRQNLLIHGLTFGIEINR